MFYFPFPYSISVYFAFFLFDFLCILTISCFVSLYVCAIWQFFSFFVFSFFLSFWCRKALQHFWYRAKRQIPLNQMKCQCVSQKRRRKQKKKQKNKINEKKKIRRKKNEMENGESSFSLICAVNQTQLLGETGDIELPLDGHRFIESSRISKRSIRFIPFLTPSLNNHAA